MHCVKIIVGDMNAKVGKKRMYRPIIRPDNLHEFSNENKTRLIYYAYSKDLTISRQ